MKSYQLHTAEGWHADFAGLSPRVWLENELLRTWIIAEPATISRILRSHLTRFSDLVDFISIVKAKYGVELPNFTKVNA